MSSVCSRRTIITQEPQIGGRHEPVRAHGGAELKRHTERVADVQRLALVRSLNPLS
jgi:hypothetical protein